MADEQDQQQLSQDEIATIAYGRDITRGYVEPMRLLQPTDTILMGRGAGDYAVYDEILRDDQVHSTFQQRRKAVTSRPWEVTPGGDSPLDEEAAEFVRQTLARLNFDRLTEKMLFGLFYGFAVAECLWAPRDGRIDLVAVKVRNRRRFRFSGDGALRLLTREQPQGEVLPDRKFWVFSTGASDDDEPYGLGLAHWLYWPTLFKRNGLKFWLMFIEKYGMPTPHGKYPANASKEDKQRLLETCVAIQSDSAVVTQEGMSIDLVESARSGSADQSVFYDKMNAAISKIVLSQTMTTDDGASLAQGSVHMDVRQEVVRSDADLVCESFSDGPLRWLVEYNFPGAALPKVWRQMPRAAEQAAKAELITKVVSTGVARPTLQSIQDTFDGEWEAAPTPPPPTSGFGGGGFGAAFAERPPMRCGHTHFADGDRERDDASVLAEQVEDLTGDAIDGMVDAVRRAIMGARDWDDARVRLSELIATSDVDPALIAGIVDGALQNAHLSGAADVVDEINGRGGR